MGVNETIETAIFLVVCALGFPGNILSAIVWLRRRKNSSVIYLAALAINDLVILLIELGGSYVIPNYHKLPLYYMILTWYLLASASILEPMLIFCFSVERLFAILRPLKVSFPYINAY